MLINLLLIFMISLQFGSYEMMITNTLRMFSGQVQIQKNGYKEGQKIRQSIDNISERATDIRRQFPQAAVTAHANVFVLVSSEDRSFGTQVVGVEPASEAMPGSHPIDVQDRSGRRACRLLASRWVA